MGSASWQKGERSTTPESAERARDSLALEGVRAALEAACRSL